MLQLDRIVDADLEDWLLDASRQLFDWFGGRDWLLQRKLVLPTADFFERKEDSGGRRAARLFADVKRHAGLEDVECELRVHEGTPSSDLGGLAYQVFTSPTPAGTFSHEGGNLAPVVTYAADQADDPVALIATFAHELAHLKMSAMADPPPGGWDLVELATDLGAVLMGYGVFMANAAFAYGKVADFDRQGWSVRRQGYLSENALVFCLAIFLSLRGETAESAKRYLKPHLGKLLDKAIARIAKRSLTAGFAG